MYAVTSGNSACVQALLDGGAKLSLNAINAVGESAFQIAMRHGPIEIASSLAQHGANCEYFEFAELGAEQLAKSVSLQKYCESGLRSQKD